MPNIFKGTLNSGTIESPTTVLPFQITFFTIANKNTGSTTVNVWAVYQSHAVSIVPKDLQLSEGDMLEGDSKLVMEPGSLIRITVDNPVDYFFTIDNIQSP